jgi:hypothetical protein
MSQKKHQCLHSMQEWTRDMYTVGVRDGGEVGVGGGGYIAKAAKSLRQWV